MLTLKDISKNYLSNKGTKVEALKKVNLSFNKKGIIFIVGKSGSGKTTLLNIIGGIDTCSSGQVVFNKISLSNMNRHNLDKYRCLNIGYIFQEFNLLHDINIKENIELPLELQNKKTDMTQIENVLEMVGLKGYENRMPEELSVGQKQRIAIARALIKNPDIILADEPTGSLDSETGTQIFRLLKSVSKTRLVIVVTHDIESAYYYGDRVIEISDGLIVSDSNEVNDENGEENTTDNHNALDNIKPSFISNNASIRIGLNYLFRKPFRLILTIFISSIAFVLFAISSTMAGYNLEKAVLESMNSTNINYFSIQKNVQSLDKEGFQVSYNPYLNVNDISKLNERFPWLLTYPVIKNISSDISSNIFYEFQSTDYYYSNYIYGGFEISEEKSNQFGFSLIAGVYPEKTNKDNEILISVYIYEMFQKYGYRSHSTDPIENISSPSDLLGKIITISQKEYEIVGILETEKNDLYFEKLKNLETIGFNETLLIQQHQAKLENGFSSLVFLRDGYYDDVIYPEEYYGTYVISQQMPIELQLDKNAVSLNNSDSIIEFYEIANETYIPEDIIWKDEIKIDSLSPNQIILPVSCIPKSVPIGEISTLNSLINSVTYQLIEQHALEHFSEISSEFNPDPLRQETYIDYVNYIYFSTSAEDGLLNLYETGFEKDYFDNESTKIVLQQYYFDILDSLDLYRNHNGLLFNQKVEVVGFYYETSFRNHESTPIIVSNSIYTDFISVADADYSILMSPISNSRSQNIDFIIYSLQNNNGVQYKLENQSTTTLYYFSAMFSSIASVMFILKIIFLLIAVFIVSNYILLTIAMKKKEIGILRAIGAKSIDIVKIFGMEGIAITTMNFIVSCIIFLITRKILSNIVLQEFNLIVDIIPLRVIPFIEILIFSVLVGSISLVIPIKRLSKQQPIDVIRNL